MGRHSRPIVISACHSSFCSINPTALEGYDGEGRRALEEEDFYYTGRQQHKENIILKTSNAHCADFTCFAACAAELYCVEDQNLLKNHLL